MANLLSFSDESRTLRARRCDSRFGIGNRSGEFSENPRAAIFGALPELRPASIFFGAAPIDNIIACSITIIKVKAILRTALSKTDRLNLEQVVSSLNGENPRLTSADVAALVRFVEAWNKANRNPWKMKMTQGDVTRFSLSRLSGLWESRLAPIGRTSHVEKLIPGLIAQGIRVKDESDEPGGAYWTQSPNSQGARDTAALCVTMLLTNPLRGKLSDGPCQRSHCGRWFIKRRPLQKCCGSSCLRIIQTAGRIQKQREVAQTDKLRKARAAQQSWRTSDTQLDWKAWVSKETGLSRKFLTRYVNKRKLRTPHKLGRIIPMFGSNVVQRVCDKPKR